MPKSRLLLVVLAALALLAASCANGDDPAPSADSPTPSQPEEVDGPAASYPIASETDEPDQEVEPTVPEAVTGFPVTIESDGGTFTLESPPERIVSLSPSATEILFAIGAGSQVLAVDSYSYHPPEAPVTDLSGWDPNVEAVTAYEPDLVVISNDANELVASLSAVEIPVLVSSAPSDIEGGFDAIADLGAATGHAEESEALVVQLREQIDTALAAAPDVATRVYHELGESYYSASSNSFIGAVYAAMGATNIADEADPDGYGFPQLTQEYIIEADPELIVITDQVAYSADDVAARAGWGEISAVKNGNIVVVKADIASRWGPRLPQLIAVVADALATVATELS